MQSGSAINTTGWNSAGLALVPNSLRLNCTGLNPVAANPTPDSYFVREGFYNTIAGQFGNCGRNNLIGPSTWNVDFSAIKDFHIHERHALQFRMEMFNAPNHPAWGSPSASWGTQSATPSTGFGRIRGTSQLRLIQFALKYHFGYEGALTRGAHSRLQPCSEADGSRVSQACKTKATHGRPSSLNS